jgi:hypothetical protein
MGITLLAEIINKQTTTHYPYLMLKYKNKILTLTRCEALFLNCN